MEASAKWWTKTSGRGNINADAIIQKQRGTMVQFNRLTFDLELFPVEEPAYLSSNRCSGQPCQPQHPARPLRKEGRFEI